MSQRDLTVRTPQIAAPEQHDGRRWLMLAVLLLGQFMGLIDVLIVNVAMPEIGTNLHASGATLQLVVGGYTVAYAMLLITGARLGDLYGRRRMYMLGAIVFTAASLGCALAPNSVVLVSLRFIQGAGAAVMVPQIMSVIQMRFTGAARAKAMSAYGLVLSSGAAIGLVLGGVLVTANIAGLGWRTVFLVNIPLGLLLTVLVPRVVPADRPSGTRRIDVVGLLIASVAVSAVVLPLVLGHDLGWPTWTFACIAGGLVLAGLFVWIERRIQARNGDPLLNLDVLRAKSMGTGLATLACMQVAWGGFLFIFTLHLEAGLGYSPLRAGLTYIPTSVTFGLGGILWRRLPERLHHAVGAIGLTMCTLGYLGISIAMRGGGQGSALMWVALTVTGAGLGLSAAPLMTQSLAGVPRTQAADASGVLTTTVQMGQVVGVAVFGTVFLSLLKASVVPHSHASASALTTTSLWLALLSAVGVLAGLALSRSLRASQIPGPVPQPPPAR